MKKPLRFKISLGPAPSAPLADPLRERAADQFPPARSLACHKQNQHRSRSGCAQCKRRRVKCDETFPVCLSCRRRGDFCELPTRLRQWQTESPLIFRSAKTPAQLSAPGSSKADQTLLRYWLERASQIMVIDPDVNPMSFPVLEYIERSPSLMHVIQSIGAGHMVFFNPSKLGRCLDERSMAIKLLRQELMAPIPDVFPVFLTIMLLGLSSAWINPPLSEFGQQHLQGARALVDTVLSDPSLRQEQPHVFNFILGAYLWWDMSCAFIVPSDQQRPVDTPEIILAVSEIGRQFHPIGGYCTEIFYLLGGVSRYCRSVVETGVRNEELETSFRDLILEWQPTCDKDEQFVLCEAFRWHGLINLALCGRARSPAEQRDTPPMVDQRDVSSFLGNDGPDTQYWPFQEDLRSITDHGNDMMSYGELRILFEEENFVLKELAAPFEHRRPEGHFANTSESAMDMSVGEGMGGDASAGGLQGLDMPSVDTRASIRQQASMVVRSLLAIPPNHPCVNLQPIPLLTAASELTEENSDVRTLAIGRFRELHSMTRCPGNSKCIILLEHLWELRDSGEDITWVELMCRKGWNIMLG